MISFCKDSDGRILSFMEWRQVGQSGFDKLNGDFIFIADFWIHENHRNNWEIFRHLLNDILRKSISAKWVYFQRKKYQGRQSKNYTRSQIMKLLDRSPMMVIREVA